MSGPRGGQANEALPAPQNIGLNPGDAPDPWVCGVLPDDDTNDTTEQRNL